MGHFSPEKKAFFFTFKRSGEAHSSIAPPVQRPQWFSYQPVSNELRGRVPAAPRPLCLAPFSQDPMIGNYHTQVIVTVRYISTLQLPSLVHVGRFSDCLPNLWNERMRDSDRRSACVGIIQSGHRKIRAGPASSSDVRDGPEISNLCTKNSF
jgi:hypothetical protein